MSAITRRAVIAASAVAAAAAPTLSFPNLSFAAAPAAKQQAPGAYRFRLGAYELTAIYDGLWPLKIDDNFIRNASNAEVEASLAAAFLPPGILQINFTALLVNTGRR